MKDESKQWPHERIAALEAALRSKDQDVADAVALVLCHEAKIDRLAAELRAVREQYDNWIGEKQGYAQTLSAIYEIVKGTE